MRRIVKSVYICKVIAVISVVLGCCVPEICTYAQHSKDLKLKTVVIDPGHGGKDPGCVSRDRRMNEKTITLAVSKLLGEKIKAAYPDVKVVYTRTTDTYVTLNDRASIANKANANLFISIHVNSVSSTSPHGFSTHILGQSRDKNRDLFSYNMDVCRRENSVIMLEEDYSTKYQGYNPDDPESFIFFNLMQNAFYEQSLLFAAEADAQMKKGPIAHSRGVWQDPFLVLWKTTMPAVLVELGFISNSADLRTMSTASGRNAIAQSLFNSFRAFKAKYDGSIDISAAGGSSSALTSHQAEAESKPVLSGSSVKDGYGVQIFVLSKKLPSGDKAFKGTEPEAVFNGTLYKYIIRADTPEKARQIHKDIKKKFPDSFPVKMQGNKVVRL